MAGFAGSPCLRLLLPRPVGVGLRRDEQEGAGQRARSEAVRDTAGGTPASRRPLLPTSPRRADCYQRIADTIVS